MNDKYFKDNDIVKSCKFVEHNACFQLHGVTACTESTFMSEPIISAEEMKNMPLSHGFIVERRKELFYALNGKGEKSIGACEKCANIYENYFAELRFDLLGGSMAKNIQHYTICNLECTYCCYSQRNEFLPQTYPNEKILEFFKCFSDMDKIFTPGWITFSGGEPTLLKNLGDFISNLIKVTNFDLCLFTNATIFNNEVNSLLKDNKIFLTTSIDAGLPSTFYKIRGGRDNELCRVLDNLIRYKKSGTKNLWLKYILTENNISDDDLHTFVFTMAAVKPDKIYIAVDFPYGEKEIPYTLAVAGGKLWYLLDKYTGIHIQYYSDVATADTKFAKFYRDMRAEYDKLAKFAPIDNTYNLLSSYQEFEDLKKQHDVSITQESIYMKLNQKIKKLCKYCIQFMPTIIQNYIYKFWHFLKY
jgi:uncharacterized Fe-S cluster-containing radical SAM superfamily protein